MFRCSGAVAITLAVVMFCGACAYAARKHVPAMQNAGKKEELPNPFPTGVAEGQATGVAEGQVGQPQLQLPNTEGERV